MLIVIVSLYTLGEGSINPKYIHGKTSHFVNIYLGQIEGNYYQMLFYRIGAFE